MRPDQGFAPFFVPAGQASPEVTGAGFAMTTRV
jgi:hypothetical protein